MKQDMTIDALVQRAAEINENKRDFRVDTRNLQLNPVVTMEPSDNLPFLEPAKFDIVVADNEAASLGEFRMQDHCAGQVADKMKIPRKYFWRMWNDAPSLLAHNVNHWFKHSGENVNLVRTLEGNARAFLSSGYRVVDHLPMLGAILPVMAGRSDLKIESSAITDYRLYLKFTLTSMEAEIEKVGQTIRFGGILRNSEIGLGGYELSPFGVVVSCTNGMTFDKPIGGGRHIGRRIGSGESGGFEVDYEDDTVAADQKAIELKMRDAFATITKPEFFQKYVDKATESVDRPVHDNPADTVEIVAKEFGYRESVKDSIISHLLHGGQWNQWGVSQAVTRVAADQDSYDQASTMEADGGKILNMDGAAWKQILDAEVPN